MNINFRLYAITLGLVSLFSLSILIASARLDNVSEVTTPDIFLSTVDTGGYVGKAHDMIFVGEYPTVVYTKDGNVHYLRAEDAMGNQWGTPITIVSAGDVGDYISVAIVDGYPAISYYDSTQMDLVYVRAMDETGSSWDTPVVVEATGDVGAQLTILMVDGQPAIAYYDVTNNTLKFVRANDGTGTSWGDPTIVDTAINSDSPIAMTVVNGRPAISYGMYYIQADDTAGTSWGDPILIDSTNSKSVSLMVVDGLPAIVYYNAGDSYDLKYVRAVDADAKAWQPPITIETGQRPNSNAALQIIDGRPAIAYSSGNYKEQHIKYAIASDTIGHSWNAPILVTEADAIGLADISLTLVNGRPAITYYDSFDSSLTYVHASDTVGQNWQAPIVADSGGNVGTYTSIINYDDEYYVIAYVDVENKKLKYYVGPQFIAQTIDIQDDIATYNDLIVTDVDQLGLGYYDNNNGDLKYVISFQVYDNYWSQPFTVDTIGDVGSHLSLTIVDGNPAMSYYDATNGDLKFVRANDTGGYNWSPIKSVPVDTTGDVGTHTSLAVVNGNPAISYYDVTNGDLKFVRANDPKGTEWSQPVVVDTEGNVGMYSTLLMVNGYPVISYYDATHGDLKFIKANDASGTSWAEPILVDTNGDVGAYASLTLLNGYPIISYYDATNGDLKYALAKNLSGTTWYSPILVDSTPDVGMHTSMIEYENYPLISYHNATDGNLKQAHIAQETLIFLPIIQR